MRTVRKGASVDFYAVEDPQAETRETAGGDLQHAHAALIARSTCSGPEDEICGAGLDRRGQCRYQRWVVPAGVGTPPPSRSTRKSAHLVTSAIRAGDDAGLAAFQSAALRLLAA